MYAHKFISILIFGYFDGNNVEGESYSHASLNHHA